MTLTELRYIVTLAQEQHFGRTAERCFVSQPTLSIAVKKLEEELGIVIFERSKTRVYPTPVGEKVVHQAQRVLEQAAAIKDIVNAGKDQLSGPMRIGTIFTIGPYLLPHLIPEMQKRANDMPLYLEESYTANLRKRIRQGDLDAIVVALPFNEADVVTQAIYEEAFVVVMPKAHPLAAYEQLSPKQLEEHHVLLLGEGHCFRDQILESCPNLNSHESGHDNISTAAEGSSLETLKHMVASGLGITILPAGAAVNIADMLAVRPFTEPTPKRTIALAWRTSFPRGKAIDVLRESISSCSLSTA